MNVFFLLLKTPQETEVGGGHLFQRLKHSTHIGMPGFDVQLQLMTPVNDSSQNW